MANHYLVYVIFQDIKHQLEENILHHFLNYSFYVIFIKIENYFQSTQNYLQEAFATLPIPILKMMMILHFYHNLLCIYY